MKTSTRADDADDVIDADDFVELDAQALSQVAGGYPPDPCCSTGLHFPPSPC